MTKVTLNYDLVRPIDDTDAESISNAHGVYGLLRVSLAPTLDRIEVDYDASRLSEKDVESALILSGIPLQRHSASAG
jgi:hypothetical protein